MHFPIYEVMSTNRPGCGTFLETHKNYPFYDIQQTIILNLETSKKPIYLLTAKTLDARHFETMRGLRDQLYTVSLGFQNTFNCQPTTNISNIKILIH